MSYLKKIINFLTIYKVRSEFDKFSYINRFSVYRNVKIEKYSYVGSNARVSNCSIGKYCSISSRVTIGLPSHPIDRISSSPIFFSPKNGINVSWVNESSFDDEVKETIIGNDVWIGDNVTILGGVKIGDGAILAAGCVVTKDVMPYSIVGGVPAKLLRDRFETTIKHELANLKWWDFEESFLKENIVFFQNEINYNEIQKLKELYSNYENQR